MRESKYLAVIAGKLGLPVSFVQQSLRALREAGLIPGKSGGDLKSHDLAIVVAGLSAPNFVTAGEHVRSVDRLPLTSTADLPATAGMLLSEIITTIPTSPVFREMLDLDDGIVSIGSGRLDLVCLSLTGKRCLVRYGEVSAAPMRDFQLNDIRAIAETIGKNHENRTD